MRPTDLWDLGQDHKWKLISQMSNCFTVINQDRPMAGCVALLRSPGKPADERGPTLWGQPCSLRVGMATVWAGAGSGQVGA